jgi:hypothetical protein
LIEIPAVPVGTIFKMAPTKQQGPKEKLLKKVQSFSDTLYSWLFIDASGLLGCDAVPGECFISS